MKTHLIRLTKLLVLAALPLVLSTQADAQATRTWVSGVGDDVNPCSRTAPCKTFAGAISKTAAAGEISVLDPGGFGAVTITKSITLSGDGTLAGILAGGGNGIIVNTAASDTVIIRSLSIVGATGATNGITFIGGGDLHVENTTITGFTGQAINFVPNTGKGQLFVTNMSARGNLGGIFVAPTAAATAVAAISNSSLDGNGRGLRAEDGATVVVRNSHSAGNDYNGFVAYGVTRAVNLTLENCVAAGSVNGGVYAGPLSVVKISNVNSSNNAYGLIVDSGQIVSYGNNRISGNTVDDGAPTSTISQK